MGKMIEVNNVSMRFRMANDRVSSFKEFAIRKLKGDLKYSEFEALKNVSFSVEKGEVVGLIGQPREMWSYMAMWFPCWSWEVALIWI